MPFVPKILVINPNTTALVTERFVAACRRFAGETATFEGVTGRFGAAIVSTEAENIVAGHAALELLAGHRGGADAVMLAISFDTALDAMRELVPIPVVGITEAALLAAGAHGAVGMITFGAVSLPLYERLVTRYRLQGRVVGIETVEIETTAAYLNPADGDAAILAAGRRQIALGARALVICGAALAGVAERLQPALGAPVFDSAAPAVARTLDLLRQPMPDHAPARPISTMSGVAPELSALIEGRDAGLPPALHLPPST